MAEKQSKLELVKLIGKAMSYQFKVTPAHKKLHARLDQLANGYPKTKGGADMRMLAQLFTKDEAELASRMGDGYETAASMAKKLGWAEEKVAPMMAAMGKKGLIFHRRREETDEYHLAPFLVGIFEFQINNFDAPMGVNAGMMFQGGFRKTLFQKSVPHLRTVPIQAEIMPKDSVMPYDDAAAIIASRERIALGECICRKLAEGMGDPCSMPMDTCFSFNEWADYYVENGIAHYISKDEALEKLKRNDELGLINQVANSQDPELMCSCCKCHCNLLSSMREAPGPAMEKISNYVCAWDASACVSCGACAKRCPLDAHTMTDGKHAFDPARCIGCGLCVTACPAKACTLEARPDEAQYVPLDTLFDTYEMMGKEGRQG